MTDTRLVHTSALEASTLADVRALLDEAFAGGFSDQDWDHGLGGMHALVRDGGDVVAHGSVVMRRLLCEGRSLRCGYVEAVAVRLDRRGAGLGHLVMEQLEKLAPAYDLLALSASEAGLPLYLSRGWLPWRGPTSVIGPAGVVPTPDDDGSVLVRGQDPLGLDVDAAISCDWRDGDVW